jgi:hypothetical protein
VDHDFRELFEAETHQHQRARVQPKSVMKTMSDGKPDAAIAASRNDVQSGTEVDL